MQIFDACNIKEGISEKDRRILPIYFPPPLKVFSHHIFPMSILLANEKFSNLLVNYYIQLSFNTYYDIHDINLADRGYPIVFDFFPNLHFIDRTTAYLKILELTDKEIEIKQDRIIDIIVNWIDNGYYPYFNLDESQIPGTQIFKQKLPLLHPIFIFGYDKSQKILKSINYDSNTNVSIIDIKFDDFEKAFLSPVTKKLLNEHDWGRGLEYVVNLFKRNDEAKIEINPTIIKNSLKDFISSRNFLINYELFYQKEDWMKWGMETYDSIQLHLNTVKPEFCFDYRIFFCLLEHKMLMSNRIEILEKNNILDPTHQLLVKSQELVKKANVLKDLSIKYHYTRNPSISDRMSNHLIDIKNMEEILLNNLLSELEKNI